VTNFYLTGVRLALRSYGLVKLAESNADRLAATLQQMGQMPPRIQPGAASDQEDPKDPADTRITSSSGPFSGDTLTSLGLNAGVGDFAGF